MFRTLLQKLARKSAERQEPDFELDGLVQADEAIEQDDADVYADRRVEPRKACFKYANIESAYGTHVNCIVKDFSRTGARVHMHGAFAIQQPLRISVSGMFNDMRADLCWQDGEEVGLKFHAP